MYYRTSTTVREFWPDAATLAAIRDDPRYRYGAALADSTTRVLGVESHRDGLGRAWELIEVEQTDHPRPYGSNPQNDKPGAVLLYWQVWDEGGRARLYHGWDGSRAHCYNMPRFADRDEALRYVADRARVAFVKRGLGLAQDTAWTREEYEAACARIGIEAATDALCDGYAAHYFQITIDEHGPDALIATLLGRCRMRGMMAEHNARIAGAPRPAPAPERPTVRCRQCGEIGHWGESPFTTYGHLVRGDSAICDDCGA